MVRHIVSWNFRSDVDEQTRKEVWKTLAEEFPKLVEKIPCVRKVEVGMPPLASSNADAVLYTELDDEASIAVYQNHPEHLKIAAVVRANCQDRRCTDILSEE